MCGIAGFVDFSKSPQRSVLVNLLETIVHRGPDSRGFYLDKYAALGIQRLSIIDLTTGDQPITNEDGSLIVVFNGEIYNYQELREKLLNSGHKFRTNSDTETLVHLYEEYGVDTPKFLNGMFAFAIWDKQKKEIFIARDQYGIKPLYYLHQGPLFIFGSEVKAILKHPRVKRSINPSAVSSYAQFGYFPGDISIFSHVHKLVPGTSLRFSENKLKQRQYWQLSIPDQRTDVPLAQLLYEAVKYQSIADVPVGVLLSGGLDSSLLLYFLKKVQKKSVHTFSVGFGENSFNEKHFAFSIAKQLGSTHHETNLTSEEMLTLVPMIAEKLDEPLSDPSLFPTYKVAQLAQKYVKVALSGDGGDELFGGYPTYQGHLVAEKFPKMFALLLTKVRMFLENIPVAGNDFPLVEVAKVFLTGLDKPTLERHKIWMQALFSDATKLLRPEYELNILDDVISKVNQLPTDEITKVQALDTMTYLRDFLLVKADRASMFNSLELRVPYLDPGLISYAFSSNQPEKVDIFVTKKSLRKLAASLFPPEIWRRKKKGFGIPLVKWMSTTLKSLIEESLAQEAIYEFFDRKKVLLLYESFNINHAHARSLWTLFIFSNWLKKWGNV